MADRAAASRCPGSPPGARSLRGPPARRVSSAISRDLQRGITSRFEKGFSRKHGVAVDIERSLAGQDDRAARHGKIDVSVGSQSAWPMFNSIAGAWTQAVADTARSVPATTSPRSRPPRISSTRQVKTLRDGRASLKVAKGAKGSNSNSSSQENGASGSPTDALEVVLQCPIPTGSRRAKQSGSTRPSSPEPWGAREKEKIGTRLFMERAGCRARHVPGGRDHVQRPKGFIFVRSDRRSHARSAEPTCRAQASTNQRGGLKTPRSRGIPGKALKLPASRPSRPPTGYLDPTAGTGAGWPRFQMVPTRWAG